MIKKLSFILVCCFALILAPGAWAACTSLLDCKTSEKTSTKTSAAELDDNSASSTHKATSSAIQSSLRAQASQQKPAPVYPAKPLQKLEHLPMKTFASNDTSIWVHGWVRIDQDMFAILHDDHRWVALQLYEKSWQPTGLHFVGQRKDYLYFVKNQSLLKVKVNHAIP